MHIVCLDLEGVLVPEIWIGVAQKTGIEQLRLTTRDVPDYDQLMQYRIEILRDHQLTLGDIQDVISTLQPLSGALEFLDWLRSRTQVIILSDTFSEFARPLMKALHWPTLFCNSLVVDDHNAIISYRLRQQDGKYKSVIALQSIGFSVLAGGDSYNDLAMIKQADRGVLFRAPDRILAENPQFDHTTTYEEFKLIIDEFVSD